MRADRLLSILLLLQTGGNMTARELAERLEVSERTIYRDLDALSAAGVPVYAERGPGGGCGLQEDYRTNLTGLNETEVRTLFMSSVPGPLADLGLGKAMEDALLKLLASLPSSHRGNAERARRRIHLDAAGWNRPEEEVPYLQTMQEAVWRQRRLCVLYRRGSDNALAERIVEPYGLVAKASVWYLVGLNEGEIKVFRVSRVNGARLTEEHFEYPADFDLADYWTQWCIRFKAGFPRYTVTVRVSPQAIPTLPHMFGEGMRLQVERAGPPDAEGWVTLPLVFESAESALGRLLGFGTTIEVLEPEELRETITKIANDLANFYKKPPPSALAISSSLTSLLS